MWELNMSNHKCCVKIAIRFEEKQLGTSGYTWHELFCVRKPRRQLRHHEKTLVSERTCGRWVNPEGFLKQVQTCNRESMSRLQQERVTTSHCVFICVFHQPGMLHFFIGLSHVVITLCVHVAWYVHSRFKVQLHNVIGVIIYTFDRHKIAAALWQRTVLLSTVLSCICIAQPSMGIVYDCNQTCAKGALCF